jgi:hypothetical protein
LLYPAELRAQITTAISRRMTRVNPVETLNS